MALAVPSSAPAEVQIVTVELLVAVPVSVIVLLELTVALLMTGTATLDDATSDTLRSFEARLVPTASVSVAVKS